MPVCPNCKDAHRIQQHSLETFKCKACGKIFKQTEINREEWRLKWKPPQIKHGVPTEWGWIVLYPENFKLGKYTDIGCFTLIQAQHGVEIGDNVQIGAGCKIYSVNTIEGTKGKVTIKQNAKIGANTVILPGVTIGENAIIGALSLVKTDIPSNEVWAGIPAKRVGRVDERKNPAPNKKA